MKFIELFAGIGAFRLGLENTGHECVWANEWLEKPRRIYERNFGEQPDPRDIVFVRGDELPPADLLVGGFPCATFSVAGKRTGFSLEDTRGTLAFEMFRIARERRIPYILFENVKGLLNHDKGLTFQIILEVLDAMGYDAQWELLDSQHFGVPQHRERVFLIANHRDFPRPKVFPIGITDREDSGEDKKSQTEIEIAQWIRRDNAFRRFRDGIAPTLLAHMGTGGNNVPFVTGRQPKSTEVFPTIDGHYWKGISNNQGRGAIKSVKPVLDVSRLHKSPNGRMIKDDDDPVYTITAQDRHGVQIDSEFETRIRKLTPLECERLQGLPDGWTEFYSDGKRVPDSERYERCGRTITIPVVEAIGRKLYDFFV